MNQKKNWKVLLKFKILRITMNQKKNWKVLLKFLKKMK